MNQVELVERRMPSIEHTVLSVSNSLQLIKTELAELTIDEEVDYDKHHALECLKATVRHAHCSLSSFYEIAEPFTKNS